MLNRYQFEVLSSCLQHDSRTQRDIAQAAGISLGSVNKAFKEMKSLGYIDGEGSVTEKGEAALSPYKVDSAVILAAGAATRFAPLSFEKPKAMFEVRGEILIERMIRQLQEVGISDITVVVGYMKETFFYLEDEMGVKIALNYEYANRNNHSSIWAAKEALGNTYVISADQYYSENVFSPYVFEPYVSAAFSENETKEQALELDNKNRVLSISKGGDRVYYMQGPAYFDREFSRKFLAILDDAYDMPQTAGKLWDDILAENLDKLFITMRAFDEDTVHEFDFVTDLTAFDGDFFANVDSRILDNICKTLSCSRDDITGVNPIKAGLTNLSVLFEVNGAKYVYRHPGNGTEEIINRKAEAHALQVAKKLGLDATFIYEDEVEGWKISRYIEGCTDFDYRNRDHVAKGLEMIRLLHTSGETSPYSFDFYEEAVKIVRLLRERNYPLPRDFDQLAARAEELGQAMKVDLGKPVLCHNDFYGPNFLVKGGEMQLIDWEYAAMGDYACDLGNFVAQGSGYSVEEACDVLDLYYNRKPTPEEERHCLAAIGIVGYYWYVWAMYKEAMGNPVGDWLYVWYKAAKQFTSAALDRY